MTISSGGQGRKPTIGRAKNGDNVHQPKREPSGRPDDLGQLDIVGFIVSRLPSFEDPSKNHLLVLPDSLHAPAVVRGRVESDVSDSVSAG